MSLLADNFDIKNNFAPQDVKTDTLDKSFGDNSIFQDYETAASDADKAASLANIAALQQSAMASRAVEAKPLQDNNSIQNKQNHNAQAQLNMQFKDFVMTNIANSSNEQGGGSEFGQKGNINLKGITDASYKIKLQKAESLANQLGVSLSGDDTKPENIDQTLKMLQDMASNPEKNGNLSLAEIPDDLMFSPEQIDDEFVSFLSTNDDFIATISDELEGMEFNDEAKEAFMKDAQSMGVLIDGDEEPVEIWVKVLDKMEEDVDAKKAAGV